MALSMARGARVRRGHGLARRGGSRRARAATAERGPERGGHDNGEGRGGGGGGGFVPGLLLGGAVFGALGFFFAPQLSRVVLRGKEKLQEGWGGTSVPFLESDEERMESTRQNLNEKIAALNAAIDEFSAQAEGSGLGSKIAQLNDDIDSLEAAAAAAARLSPVQHDAERADAEAVETEPAGKQLP